MKNKVLAVVAFIAIIEARCEAQTPYFEFTSCITLCQNPLQEGSTAWCVEATIQNDGSDSGPFDIECDLDNTGGTFLQVLGKYCSQTIAIGGSMYLDFDINSLDASAINSAGNVPCGSNYEINLIVYEHYCDLCGSVYCSYRDEVAGCTNPYPVTVACCSGWAVSPTSYSFTAAGGSNSFTVSTTSGGCSYSASSSASWINNITYSGATVYYDVSANTTCFSRTGYIYVLDANGTSQTTYTVTEAGLSAPVTPTISGTTTICSGHSTTLSVSNSGSCTGCTYNWSNSTSGTSTTVSAANTYTVTATNSCGTASSSVTVTVTPLPTTPVVSPSGPISLCNGQNTTLSVTNTCTGCTYTWSNSSSGSSLNVSTSGSYYVAAQNSCGTSSNSNTVSVTATTVNVTASAVNSLICSGGGGTTLTATGSPATYTWSNGLGSGPSVSVNPSSTTTYTVTATNSSSCTAIGTVTVTVNPTVVPTVSISPSSPPAVCALSNSTTFNASSTNGGGSPQYQWSATGQTGGTGSTYTLNNIAANTTVSCTLTSNALCASPTTVTATATIPVTQPVTPTVNISSNNTILCINSALTLTATILNGPSGVSPSSITWYDNGSPIGTGSPLVYGGWGSAGTHTITCTIIYPLGTCVTQTNINATNSLTITVQTQAPAGVSISAINSVICQNALDSFTAYPSNGGSSPQYQWMVNGGNVGTNNPLFTSASLQNNDTIKCFITSSSLCAIPDTATSNSIIVTVNQYPVVSITPPTATICLGGSGTTLTVNGTAQLYLWSPSNGLSSTSGQSVTANPTSNTTYTVTASNGSCSATASSSVTVISQPQINISPAHPAICPGNSVELIVSPTGSAYLWSGPSGSIPSNTDSVSASAVGNYSVTVTDPGGCTGTAATSINVTTGTPPTVSAGNSQTISPGSPVALGGNPTATGGGGGYMYNWSSSPAGFTSNFSNPTVSPTATTTYFLTVTDANGCSGNASVTITIQGTQNNCDTNVHITVNHCSLVVPFYQNAEYQWQFQGMNIPGDTLRFYTATAGIGYYTCIVTIGSCVYTSNDTFLSCGTGIESLPVVQNLTIVPNPSSGSFMVSFTAAQTEQMQIKIYDLLDQVVLEEKPAIVSGLYSKQITLKSVAKGVYVFQIQTGQGTENRRIEIQ